MGAIARKTVNVPQPPARSLKVVFSNTPSREKKADDEAESPSPATPIRAIALHLDPMRVAGLQSLFAHRPRIEIVEDRASESASGWQDPNVQVALIGAQAGNTGTVALIGSIRAGRPDLPIIVMSPAAGDAAVLAALNLGAKGFLHDTATKEQFEQSVVAVALGSIWAPRQVLSRFIDQLLLVRDGHQSMKKPRFTAREQQVMDLLLEGCPNREIAASLQIEERTVKVHVARLMRKMGVRNRTSLSMQAMTRA